MLQSYLSIFAAFLLLQMVNAVGCEVSNDLQLVPGLTGSVYYYPCDLYTTEAYLSGGYVGDGSIITQDHTVYTEPGVIANNVTATELYFRNDSPCGTDGDCAGEVWIDLDYFTNADGTAVSVPFKQFAFHMHGYIIPNITGQYTINLNYIDDLAIINIGSNGFKTPNCCANYSPTGDVSGNNTIQSIWTANGPSGVNEALWTGTVITTFTSDSSVLPLPVVVIETPESTITIPWTGSVTSTTTSSTVVTGTDGKPTT
ncbi:hypothetical protein ACO0OL_001261 [Hanseniaspora opuntiae]